MEGDLYQTAAAAIKARPQQSCGGRPLDVGGVLQYCSPPMSQLKSQAFDRLAQSATAMRTLLLRLGLLALLLCAAAAGELPSVAICVAIKDQAVDVREWVHYHRAIGAPPVLELGRHPARLLSAAHRPSCLPPLAGVEKFYIWDTGSKPPLLVRQWWRCLLPAAPVAPAAAASATRARLMPNCAALHCLACVQDAVKDFVEAGLVHYEYDDAGGPRRVACSCQSLRRLGGCVQLLLLLLLLRVVPRPAAASCCCCCGCGLACAQDLPPHRLLHAVPPKAGTHGPQVALYDRCLRRWGKTHTFMAFIDTDEFVVLRDGTPDLPTLVRAGLGLGTGLAVGQVAAAAADTARQQRQQKQPGCGSGAHIPSREDEAW